jgi:heme oxygenase
MTFLKNLRAAIKTTHEQLGEVAFLKRYKTSQLSITAHYLHLCQLLPIYETLELKLKQSVYANQMPENLRHLFSRSNSLRADILSLQNVVPDQIKNSVLTDTATYVRSLNASENEHALFGHFLARILGDLFGGQIIRYKLMSQQHQSWKLLRASSEIATVGLSFYQFPEDTLKDFAKWLNENDLISKNEEVIIAGTKTAMDAHFPIFNNVEARLSAYEAAGKSRLFASCITPKELAACAITAVSVAAAAYMLA